LNYDRELFLLKVLEEIPLLFFHAFSQVRTLLKDVLLLLSEKRQNHPSITDSNPTAVISAAFSRSDIGCNYSEAFLPFQLNVVFEEICF
jgi:hypothetical protein